MAKLTQYRPKQPKTKKLVIHDDDARLMALSSLADVVVERQVAEALARGVLRQTGSVRAYRGQRAPRLSTMAREIRELKKIIEALAIRSIVYDQPAQFANCVDLEGMTVLNAETVSQMLDNPNKPNEALNAILALR